VQQNVALIDPVKSFPIRNSNECLVANKGGKTAENWPLKVRSISEIRDLVFSGFSPTRLAHSYQTMGLTLAVFYDYIFFSPSTTLNLTARVRKKKKK